MTSSTCERQASGHCVTFLRRKSSLRGYAGSCLAQADRQSKCCKSCCKGTFAGRCTQFVTGGTRRQHAENDLVIGDQASVESPAIREEHVSETRDLDALLSRVERLEKENRRLKQGALAFLLLIASVGLMAQTKQKPSVPSSSQRQKGRAPVPAGPTAVEAQSFILKDLNGHVRAELGLAGSTPSLKFKDESGSALVTLALNADAPGGPLLLLSDPQHHAAVALSVLEHAGPQLSLTGERADIQLHMGVAPDGTTLELSDKDGFTTSIGNGVVAKNNQAKQTSAASIVLYGKQRKVLWSVP